jgi:radical SAM superfamily enzyme YgiQ (UPF0313 family)
MVKGLHGNLTWDKYDPVDVIKDVRKNDRIILMTFPESVDALGLEPSVLTAAPDGDNVEFSYKNRDFNDDDVMYYMCSVYISGMAEFVSWASRHDKEKIVVGGYHPTTFPEEFLRYAHKVVKGPCDEFFETIEQSGQIVSGIVRHARLPRRDVYDIDFNQQVIPDKLPNDRVVSINTSMGCGMNPPCEFCATPIMCSTVLSKPLSLVQREADELRKLEPKFCFVRDENFFMQKDWDERLEALKGLGKLYLFASANTITPNRVRKMKECGVYMVCIGLEDPKKEYKKNRKMDAACYLLKEAGIYIYMSYIVNPLEMIGTHNAQAFYDALDDRLDELRPEMICGNFLMPFPGTALWDEYYAYVDEEDYKYYDSKTPFLVRNRALQEKMKFFLFWHQWKYYTSDTYATHIRKFDVRDTLHLRFLELYDNLTEKYETIWNVRT